jgi:hypothetical protein
MNVRPTEDLVSGHFNQLGRAYLSLGLGFFYAEEANAVEGTLISGLYTATPRNLRVGDGSAPVPAFFDVISDAGAGTFESLGTKAIVPFAGVNPLPVSVSLDLQGLILHGLADPLVSTDAATKSYVDTAAGMGVMSVFGRVGPDVIAEIGDYSFSQISGSLALSQFTPGTNGQFLGTVAGLSAWANIAFTDISGTALNAQLPVVDVPHGGTGLSTFASGALPYASALDTISALPIGTAGQVLTVAAGLPSWATLAAVVLQATPPPTPQVGSISIDGHVVSSRYGFTPGNTNYINSTPTAIKLQTPFADGSSIFFGFDNATEFIRGEFSAVANEIRWRNRVSGQSFHTSMILGNIELRGPGTSGGTLWLGNSTGSPHISRAGIATHTVQIQSGDAGVTPIRLCLDGITSSFPAIVRSGATLRARVADDSAYTSWDSLSYLVNGTQVVAAQGAAVADATGGAVIDVEARAALNSLLARARASTGHGLIAG